MKQSCTKLDTAIFFVSASTAQWPDISNNYQLLYEYHKILAACNIQGEQACEFSFKIAQSQYFLVLCNNCFILWLKSFVAIHNDSAT